MPTVTLHIRARDWEREEWRARFEADLARTGWRVVSIEPPSPQRPEYVYVLVLEPAEADCNPPESRLST